MIEPNRLREILVGGESVTVEFKGEEHVPLLDHDLVEAVVCLANGQGGLLLIGVEDDGRVTGLHLTHRTRPELLTALIANRTVPPLTVEVSFVGLPEGPVAVVQVPASSQPVAASDGRMLIRYLDTHGRPGCRPLYPHELMSWRADRGQADLTALPVPDATWDDLDLLEFARLRRLIGEYRGDATLLELSDEEISGALGLVHGERDGLTPTLAGLLLVGKEAALRKHVPTHEVAFQVLRGTDVAVNEFRRWPLLRIHEWVMEAIDVRNEEQELMVGAFRVGVPRYDQRGIREAINNALIHCDYSQLGAIHIQLHDDYALVTNPGGFVAGVHIGNLLVVAPRPRNPLLADAFKRVGLVERTGRGISIIYAGQLRNGRRPPSYHRSTEVSVTVTLDSGPADLAFVRLVIAEQKQRERMLNVDELLLLSYVWREPEIETSTAARLIQKPEDVAQSVLEELKEAGLLERGGGDRGPVYLLKARVYREFSRPEATRRTQSLDRTQLEQIILEYVEAYGQISRREASALCRLTDRQAGYLLQKLMERGVLRRVGRGPATVYRMA